MPLVVDINVFHLILKKNINSPASYQEVYTWIFDKGGKIAYGGSKYKKELGKVSKYIHILKLLNDKNQIIKLSADCVDKQAQELKQIIPDERFNDEHIVSIVIVSGAKTVCTSDSCSLVYLKKNALYKKRSCPKIISNTTSLTNTKRLLAQEL